MLPVLQTSVMHSLCGHMQFSSTMDLRTAFARTCLLFVLIDRICSSHASLWCMTADRPDLGTGRSDVGLALSGICGCARVAGGISKPVVIDKLQFRMQLKRIPAFSGRMIKSNAVRESTAIDKAPVIVTVFSLSSVHGKRQFSLLTSVCDCTAEKIVWNQEDP